MTKKQKTRKETALGDYAVRAVHQFVTTFVRAEKRDRAEKMLRSGPAKRIAALQQLPIWVEGHLQTDLTGRAGFARELEQRFGELRGTYIDDEGSG
jgi:hypothetical protein